MKLNITQSGGFAGITAPLLAIDGEALDPARARQLEALVQQADLEQLAAASSQTRGADLLHYALDIDTPEGHRRFQISDDGGPNAARFHAFLDQLKRLL